MCVMVDPQTSTFFFLPLISDVCEQLKTLFCVFWPAVPLCASLGCVAWYRWIVCFDWHAHRCIPRLSHSSLDSPSQSISDRATAAFIGTVVVFLSTFPVSTACLIQIESASWALVFFFFFFFSFSSRLFLRVCRMITQSTGSGGARRLVSSLPPMLQNPTQCGKCFARHNCMLYHKVRQTPVVVAELCTVVSCEA